jgi:hypothetical protein
MTPSGSFLVRAIFLLAEAKLARWWRALRRYLGR